jgi:replicative DNA helicase
LDRAETILAAQLSAACSGLPSIKNQVIELQYNFVLNNIKNRVIGLNFDGGLIEAKSQLQSIIDEAQIDIGHEPKDINAVSKGVMNNIVDAMSRGNQLTGKPSGWRKLDKAIGGYNAGDMIVVAGRPGMGKTAIALTFAHDFALRNGRALFLSLEMSNEQLAKRYVSLIGQIPNGRIRNHSLYKEEIDNVQQFLNTPPMTFHIDDDPDTSLQMIRGKCKLHKAKHGLDLVIIDYIQLVRVNKSHSREQEIAEISRGLKLMAKELKCTVMILAQLSRKPEERADKRPLLSDLRESGAIEQDADVVLFPFRPAYYDKEQPPIENAELIIAKNRHGESGVIDATFDGKLTKYTEVML